MSARPAQDCVPVRSLPVNGNGKAPGRPARPYDAAQFASLVQRQLALLGEDPGRAGLLRTPERVAAALAWLTRGYGRTCTP